MSSFQFLLSPKSLCILQGHNSLDMFLIPKFLVGWKVEDCLGELVLPVSIHKSPSLIIWIFHLTLLEPFPLFKYNKEILSFSIGSRKRKTLNFFFLDDSTILLLFLWRWWTLVLRSLVHPLVAVFRSQKRSISSSCEDYCCPQGTPISSWVFL